MEWGKLLTVFIACTIKPGLGGIPAAVFAFHLNFIETFIACTTGGICGTLVFTYSMDLIQKKIKIYREKKGLKNSRHNKKFTKKNRFILKVKRNFGVPGIALISPVILSIPLGVFLAIRFFGDRKKIIYWFSGSVILWTVVLYLLYNGFYTTFSKIFS
jgi:hypothetical protein